MLPKLQKSYQYLLPDQHISQGLMFNIYTSYRPMIIINLFLLISAKNTREIYFQHWFYRNQQVG